MTLSEQRPYKNILTNECIDQKEKGIIYMELFTFVSSGVQFLSKVMLKTRDEQKCLRKRKGVRKKLIDKWSESNIKTVVKEYISIRIFKQFLKMSFKRYWLYRLYQLNTVWVLVYIGYIG